MNAHIIQQSQARSDPFSKSLQGSQRRKGEEGERANAMCRGKNQSPQKRATNLIFRIPTIKKQKREKGVKTKVSDQKSERSGEVCMYTGRREKEERNDSSEYDGLRSSRSESGRKKRAWYRQVNYECKSRIRSRIQSWGGKSDCQETEMKRKERVQETGTNTSGSRGQSGSSPPPTAAHSESPKAAHPPSPPPPWSNSQYSES